jgi:hypothetical protein
MARLTTEQFIDRAKAKHGNRFDYTQSTYTSYTAELGIICRNHGYFSARVSTHLKGKDGGCKNCIKIRKSSNSEDFIKEALSKYGDRYDYTSTIYTSMKAKITLICKKHGKFQVIAQNHLYNESGCPTCGTIEAARKHTVSNEEFIKRSNKIHNNKYDYSLTEYKAAHKNVTILCPIHGLFVQRANSHMRGAGCTECVLMSITKSNEDFIHLAHKIHNNKYGYSKTNYKNSSSKVAIECFIHGVFEQRAGSHTAGQGCPKCALDESSMRQKEVANGWSLTIWTEKSKSSKSFAGFKLYFVKLFNENECFYKLGRTFCTIPVRFTPIPYEYEIIYTLTNEDPKIIFDLENKLKRHFKTLRYTPLLPFGGQSECFNFSPDDINYALRLIQEVVDQNIIPTSTK